MKYPSLNDGHPTSEELGALAHFAYRYSAPTIVRRRDERGVVEVRGGSGLLMMIGGLKRLVTASHVVEAYREEYIRDPATLFDCMTEIFNPDFRIVAEDPSSDLIVLDVEDVPLRRSQPGIPPAEWFEQHPFFGSDVNVGDRVFFGGWSKAYRAVGHRAMVLFFGYDSIVNVPVTGVSEHQIEVNFGDRSGWQAFSMGNAKPANYVEDRRLGGHSGAGVFKIQPNGTRPELIGFVRQEMHDGSGVTVCPLTKMRSDGTVKATPRGIVITSSQL
jgi:hypothetical protein